MNYLCPFCFKINSQFGDEYSFYLFTQSCCSFHRTFINGIVNKGDKEILISVIKAIFKRIGLDKQLNTSIALKPNTFLVQGSDIVMKNITWQSEECVLKIMPINSKSLKELCITAALTYAKKQVPWLAVPNLMFSYAGQTAKKVVHSMQVENKFLKEPNEPLIIVLENSGEDLRDFNFRKLEDKYSVFIQIVQTYNFLAKKFSFIHDDISLKNITARYLEKSKNVHIAKSGNNFKTNIEATLIDFGLSTLTFALEGLNNTFSNLVRKASVEQDLKYIISMIRKVIGIECNHCHSFSSLEKYLFSCLTQV